MSGLWGRIASRQRLGAVAALVVSGWLAACSAASAALPEGRHYELVSPPQKNSSLVQGGAVAATGNRVQVVTSSELSGGGLVSSLLSVRGAVLGWHAYSVLPPSEDRIGSYYLVVAQTAGLTQFLARVTQGLFIGAPTTLVHLDANGHQSILQTFTSSQLSGLTTDLISDDGTHAFANLRAAIDPAHVPGTTNVYDVQQVPPVLVDRLPDGSVPACGGQFWDSTSISTKGQHQISSDGSHVFFLSQGSDCSGPRELYVRDLNAGVTSLISAPAVSGPDMAATFVQASADGSQVAYVSSAQLSAADTNSDPDVYLWRAGVGPGSGNTCVTCAVTDANVSAAFTVASPDMSHVYFISSSQLVAGKGTAGARNLYVWHRTPVSGPAGVIDYISLAAGLPTTPYSDGGDALTPDGNVLLYRSNDPGLDAATSPVSENGGHFEYYRYDDHNGTGGAVTCVSCPLGRPATVDVPRSLLPLNGLTTMPYYNRALSDDGSRVFFRTAEPLVSGDVNQSRDVYEWHDGQVGLLTNGVTPHAPGLDNELLGSSASGDDVFISSYDALTPDVVDGANQVYDVRTGPIPAFARPAVVCEGDGCQGLPSGVPALARALSSTVVGPTGGTLAPAFAVGRPTGGSEAELIRTGRLLVPVRVNMAGKVSVSARAVLGRHAHTVATGSRVLRKAGVVSVGLRLSHAARSTLAKGGRLRVRFVVRFSKVRASKSVVVVLRVPVVRHGR